MATQDARIRAVSRQAMVVIALTTVVCGAGAFIGSQFMQRAYKSTVSMLSAEEEADSNAAARVTQQLGAVAGFLGAAVAGGRRDVSEGLATLRSRLLVADFVKDQAIAHDLFELVGPAKIAELSEEDRLHEAVSYFQDHVLTVAYDNRSSLMVVSIVWTDRYRAAELANAYVAFANEAMRQRAITSARNRKAFLEVAAEEAATVELRQAIYRLIQDQVSAEMLATTRPEFAFVVVDPAVPTGIDDFVRPLRFVMSIAGAGIGAFGALAVLFLLGRLGGSKPRS